jgi:hypothetical protein
MMLTREQVEAWLAGTGGRLVGEGFVSAEALATQLLTTMDALTTAEAERDSIRDALHDWKAEYAADLADLEARIEALEAVLAEYKVDLGTRVSEAAAILRGERDEAPANEKCLDCNGTGDSGFRGGSDPVSRAKRLCRSCNGTGTTKGERL